MKITKTNKDVAEKRMRRQIANNGCDKCPCCGETKPFHISKKVKIKGIINGRYRCETKGFFNMKTYKIDCWSCATCGAEWESEPYEV